MEKDLPERGSWCLYILRCGDGSLYAGVTIDLPRRGGQEESGPDSGRREIFSTSPPHAPKIRSNVENPRK